MKHATLTLAALILGLGSIGQAKAGYVTLNDPSATVGTVAFGIDGGNIVGYYNDGSGEHGFLYNGTSYTTLNDPSATGGTAAFGIDGGNIVGYYSDGSGEHGFLYQPDVSATPEPSSIVLFGMGTAFMAASRRWRRRKQSVGYASA